MMTYGSLFTGIGGFDLGFDRVGMRCSWQVEKDVAARSVLSRHWPDVPKFDDVCSVGAHNLEPVDVICGGFPCQDLSVAGHRAGLAGERSGLWHEFHRILREVRPRWCVIENVPGLLSSNGGRDFAVVLRGLVELGYGVSYRILDAQYFGVAQRRRRVFIVGSLGNGRSAEILFESESLPGHSAPSREARQVAATLPASGAGTGRTGNERTEAELIVPVQAVDVRNLDLTAELSGTLQAKKTGGYSLNYTNPILARSLTTREGARLDGETCTFIPIAFDWMAGHGKDDSFRGKSRQYIVRKGEYTGSLQENKRDAVLAFTSKDYGQQPKGGGGVTMAVRRLTPL